MRCESIVEPQEEGGESEGGEDVEEQTGAGTDVRSRLDVRFGLQPVEKDLNRLPQGTDAGGHGIFGNKNIVLFPLSRRDERDVPLGLQMGSPFCVDIGTICIEPAVCDRCAVQIDLLCSPQVAETGFADLYGAGDGKLMRAQLGKTCSLTPWYHRFFVGFRVKLQRFRAVFAVFDREPTDTITGQESSTYPCVGSLLASFCSNRTSASAAKASASRFSRRQNA